MNLDRMEPWVEACTEASKRRFKVYLIYQVVNICITVARRKRWKRNTRNIDWELAVHESQASVFLHRSTHLFSQSSCVRFLNYYLTNERINSKDA